MNTNEFKCHFPLLYNGKSIAESLLDSSFNRIPCRIQSESYRIVEEEKEWGIQILLPGVSKDAVKISIKESDKLVIEVSENSEWMGGFVQKFKLNPGCDIKNISAELIDGILKLKVPKNKDFHDREIQIK